MSCAVTIVSIHKMWKSSEPHDETVLFLSVDDKIKITRSDLHWKNVEGNKEGKVLSSQNEYQFMRHCRYQVSLFEECHLQLINEDEVSIKTI